MVHYRVDAWWTRLRRYGGRTVLVLLLFLFFGYRTLVYQYPEFKPERGVIDYLCDVVGYSYHFVMLTFDYGFKSGLTDDYHVTQALRYKPGDAYMQRFADMEVNK